MGAVVGSVGCCCGQVSELRCELPLPNSVVDNDDDDDGVRVVRVVGVGVGAGGEDADEARAMQQAAAAHALLGCRGVSRSDFRYDPARGLEGLFLLEVNTQPGMTPLSLVPEQARAVGLSYEALVGRLIDRAVAR
jgi:hypothetical protein